jgi:hypothetical protein
VEDNSFDLIELKLDVDTESLMNHIGYKDLGFSIKGIYMSEVAMAVYLTWESEAFDPDRIRECLGRLLRFLSGHAEEMGFVFPMLCFFSVLEECYAKFKDNLNQLVADQDWHRGDFSIVFLSESKDKENGGAGDTIQNMLGKPSTVWPNIELKPRDIEAVIESFQSEMRSMQISAEYASLLSAIAQALKEGTKVPLQNWLNERKEDLHKLMTWSEYDEK